MSINLRPLKIEELQIGTGEQLRVKNSAINVINNVATTKMTSTDDKK